MRRVEKKGHKLTSIKYYHLVRGIRSLPYDHMVFTKRLTLCKKWSDRKTFDVKTFTITNNNITKLWSSRNSFTPILVLVEPAHYSWRSNSRGMSQKIISIINKPAIGKSIKMDRKTNPILIFILMLGKENA